MLTKGFVRIFSRQSSDGEKVASHGELSRTSWTYAKEIDSYLPEDYSNYEYLAFVTRDDDENDGELNSDQLRRLFDIVDWFYNEAVNEDLPSERDAIQERFFEYHSSDDYAIDDIGPLVTDDDFQLPGYIHFRYIGGDDDEETEYYIWFADEIFQTTYDSYDLTIIPPTDDLDDVFDRPSHVEEKSEERTYGEFIERIEEHRRGEPCTYLRTERVTFKHPSDLDYEYDTHWTFLIYGQAGNNFDTLLQEIENLIEEESEYSLTEWRELAPSFFHHTEFIIIPFWDQYAIENNNLEAGIYSPIVKYKGLIDKAKDFTSLEVYDEDYLEEELTIVHSAYKNLPLLVIGNPENKEDKTQLQDVFSDYIVVPSTSSEFSKMSNETQDWVVKLNKALREAEKADSYNFLPDGMERLYRNDLMYIYFEYEGFRYLILSRMSHKDKTES